ncbi:MAG: glutathione S-transferase family protein [Pseudomonadota bacterium]
MRLHQNGVSPFARKVRVVLIETDQEGDVEMVEARGDATSPVASPSIPNPVGKIPALERGDGPTLFDSRVICRFLNARASGDLYPEGRLWDVLTLEALADGMLDAAVLMVYEERYRPEDGRSAVWLEGQWAKVNRALDGLDGRWLSHLSGPVDMGHIAIGCALGYLDMRHPDRAWRTGRDGLSAWEADFAARPSMAATKPS